MAAEILAFMASQGRDQPTGTRPRYLLGSRPRRPAVGWPSLTEAELPVVRLAAEGHANSRTSRPGCACPAIPSETHLKHVFAKLGVGFAGRTGRSPRRPVVRGRARTPI